MAMNKEIKAKWLEALRSGRYKQGRTLLRSIDDEYCCLGVLCDIVDPDGWINHKAGYSIRDGHYSVLGKDIRAQTSIAISDCIILMNLNDRDRLSFSQIADWIELYNI